MSTSIRDLARHLDAEACFATISAARAQDAVLALGHLGRALRSLADDGLDRNGTARGQLTRDLAESCVAASRTASTGHSGRTSTIAGALADAIASRRLDLDREQRWAIVATLATSSRVLIRYVGGSAAPCIASTGVIGHALGVRAVTDPPTIGADRALDRTIPALILDATTSLAVAAAEAAAVLSHRLSGARIGQHRPPTLLEIFAVTRAAESAAHYAAAITAALTDRPVPAVHPGPAAWRAVRAQLHPFTATAPAAVHDNDLTALALTIHTGLRDALGPIPQISATQVRASAEAVRSVQRIINELPALADAVTAAVGHLADAGDLHAFANRLPFRDDRVPQILARTPVVADRLDLTPLIAALTAAGDHSADLSLAQHAAVGVTSEQPGLLAANTAQTQNAATRRATQPPTIRWAALAAALHPDLPTDPHWPALATQMDRIHASGGDLPALLTHVSASHPLPTHHPARALDYRLHNAAPDLLPVHTTPEASATSTRQEVAVTQTIAPAPQRTPIGPRR